MTLLELILISIGLAMDCFAVSFCAGASQKELRFKNIFILACFFGIFQGVMPLIGYYTGEAVVSKISHFDHWITFGILAFIGGKMIFEALFPEKEEKKVDITKIGTIFILSIATSIDALAMGFGFAMITIFNIWYTIILITVFSFILSIIGVYTGKKLSSTIKPSYAEIIGGIILISIGIKILIDHSEHLLP